MTSKLRKRTIFRGIKVSFPKGTLVLILSNVTDHIDFVFKFQNNISLWAHQWSSGPAVKASRREAQRSILGRTC